MESNSCTHILERVLKTDNYFAYFIDEKTEMEKRTL